jgi:hypothetical protein
MAARKQREGWREGWNKVKPPRTCPTDLTPNLGPTSESFHHLPIIVSNHEPNRR